MEIEGKGKEENKDGLVLPEGTKSKSTHVTEWNQILNRGSCEYECFTSLI